MATKTKKRSGFDVPTYGVSYAKGTKIKKNPDGTVSLEEPKKKKNTKTRK